MDEHNMNASKSAMEHARYLADMIGPRGSTTSEESFAADYALQVLEEAGLETLTETFNSPKSAWLAFALAATLALMAEVLFLFGGQVGAILSSGLMLFVLVSLLMELTLHGSPLQWILSKGKSQNVWAKIPAVEEARQRVLLIGHLDTHRTPKLFSTPLWLSLFRIFIWLSPSVIALNTLIFMASIFVETGWWRAFSLVLALAPWWISVLTFEADYTPYTAGANDNASGAGMVLRLAARLGRQPLRTTEVWTLCSGCKEVGGYGIAHFIAGHAAELGRIGNNGQANKTCCVVLDSVGGQGTQPCYIEQETYLTTVRGDPNLLRVANEVAESQPQLNARRSSLSGMYTEAHLAARAGLPTLAFVNLRKDSTLPHWHQATDVFANLDGLVMQDTENFVWEFLHELDKQKRP